MSYDLSILKQHQLAGKTYAHQETLTKGGLTGLEKTIPVADAGTLTTRTDANTGTVTMTASDHGITTGSIVDVYWSGGQRRGMLVGSVSGTSVPIDLGSGTDLPVTTTAVQVAVVQSYSLNVTGNQLAALLASADFTRAQVVLKSQLNDSTQLNFGSSSPVAAFTLPALAVVTRVDVDVDVAFDGSAPTVAVGVAGTVEKFLADDVADLTTIGHYTFSPSVAIEGGTQAIILTYVADSSAAGAARVTVYYRVEELAVNLPENGAYGWVTTSGVTNPLADDTIDQVLITIADTVTTRSVRLVGLLDI